MIERVHIHARWLAAHFGQRAQDTEHLLLGVLSDEDPQNKIFRDVGLRFEDAYQELTGEPPSKELLPPRDVIIPIGDFKTALRMLPKVLPAGVTVAPTSTTSTAGSAPTTTSTSSTTSARRWL